ncbi:hypothetical protein [Mycolicibacter senuensis]|jgi:hypothetical protein|uniref:hypothetical protein n=1 Tax=Mycolicibacter senuensis TaxID=386913 RepID=UPI000DCD78F4|nr:hypothetical protein [Mycolicibacter senuensis]RAU92738.1 hypothetical protein DQP56_20055 [Mycolicibacter senuensis]
MSRIRKYLTVAAGAAAGLFLGALASSTAATADTAPINPGLPGVVEQMVASSTAIPQQLLQTTTSALSGTPLAPAASPAQSPIATATLNVPQTTTTASQPAGLPGLANLSSVLPFPLPNFGGTTPVAAAPTTMVPGIFAPTAPVTPMEVMLIPGLP